MMILSLLVTSVWVMFSIWWAVGYINITYVSKRTSLIPIPQFERRDRLSMRTIWTQIFGGIVYFPIVAVLMISIGVVMWICVVCASFVQKKLNGDGWFQRSVVVSCGRVKMSVIRTAFRVLVFIMSVKKINNYNVTFESDVETGTEVQRKTSLPNVSLLEHTFNLFVNGEPIQNDSGHPDAHDDEGESTLAPNTAVAPPTRLTISPSNADNDLVYNPNDKLYVCNHVSYLDICTMLTVLYPSFVSKMGVRRAPFIGDIARAVSCIFVDRNDAKQRQRALAELQRRAFNGNVSMTDRPVVVFPEGTTTNGRYLAPFKRGAFQAMVPVKPIVLNYTPHKLSSFYPSYEVVSIQWTFAALVADIFGCEVDVYHLPTMSPTPREVSENDVTSFADRVYNAMDVALAAANGDPRRSRIDGDSLMAKRECIRLIHPSQRKGVSRPQPNRMSHNASPLDSIIAMSGSQEVLPTPMVSQGIDIVGDSEKEVDKLRTESSIRNRIDFDLGRGGGGGDGKKVVSV